LLLPRLYKFVSNNVWVVAVLCTFPSPLFSLTPVYAQPTKQNMPKQRRQHYLTYTATRSQWQFQLSKISQQTVMCMKTDITYGTPSVGYMEVMSMSSLPSYWIEVSNLLARRN
jgi:hypothetical protein